MSTVYSSASIGIRSMSRSMSIGISRSRRRSICITRRRLKESVRVTCDD